LLTVVKLGSLGLFIVAGLLLAEHRAAPAPGTTPATGQWIDALVTLIFAYGGFEASLIPAAELKDPRRDLPFALCLALPVVAGCYLLIHLVAMWTVPDLAHSERPLADAARAFAGPGGAAAIAAGALISACGWLSVQFVSAPRLTYALAERGDFPPVFAAVHPRFRTPYISILLYTVLVLVLSLSGSFIWNVFLSVAARLVTYAATCVALIRRRRLQPAADAWRAPAGNLLALLGIAFCALLISRLTAAHAGIVAIVAVVATANWLAVRSADRR
ncbi:MAG: APC family permease, partial [Burkholderiales bacterium]